MNLLSYEHHIYSAECEASTGNELVLNVTSHTSVHPKLIKQECASFCTVFTSSLHGPALLDYHTTVPYSFLKISYSFLISFSLPSALLYFSFVIPRSFLVRIYFFASFSA
jgi:hypothetical protein